MDLFFFVLEVSGFSIAFVGLQVHMQARDLDYFAIDFDACAEDLLPM